LNTRERHPGDLLRLAHDLGLTGVLAFRLATFWIPIIPGYLAFRSLTRRDLL
jgi:uncharacterized membrane protein YbhN (UPF0104 family)